MRHPHLQRRASAKKNQQDRKGHTHGLRQSGVTVVHLKEPVRKSGFTLVTSSVWRVERNRQQQKGGGNTKKIKPHILTGALPLSTDILF